MDFNRLETYLLESQKHKEHIIEAKEELHLPIQSYEKLSKLERFALNTLIFRFSKLQDLLGTKLFVAFLDYTKLPTNELSFFDILKMIEKVGIVDIDTWSLLRSLRNDIAHDYPEEMDEVIEKINLFVSKSDTLLLVLDNLQRKYLALKQERNQYN